MTGAAPYVHIDRKRYTAICETCEWRRSAPTYGLALTYRADHATQRHTPEQQ